MYTLPDGTVLRVGRLLAAGGQGQVYEVSSRDSTVLKKYLPGTLASDQTLRSRLRAMVDNPPEWREPASGHVTLAWPSELVLLDQRFDGFLMPAVDFSDTVSLHRVTNPSDRSSADGPTSWLRGFTWRYLVRTSANLVHATRVLHQSGVVIGDFNESNVRVTREARVTLLDCDSMQITDPATGQRFYCPVGRLEFLPPELLNANWRTTVRHPSSDLFALAIHLYQLLLEGEHPFRGVWRGPGDKPPVPELARQGIWAHLAGGPLSPRPAAIGIDLLPGTVVDLFRQAFEEGAINPTARPDANRWHRALSALEQQLTQCPAVPAHVYPRGHSKCPWCQWAWHGSRAVQRPLPPAVAPLAPRRAARLPVPPPMRSRSPRGSAPSPAPSPASAPGRLAAPIAGAVLIILVLLVVFNSISSHAPGPSGPAPVATFASPGRPGPDGLSVSSVAFSGNGATLAIADSAGKTCLWSASTRRKISCYAVPGVDGSAVAFSPDGKTIANGEDDYGSVYLRQTAGGRRVFKLTDPAAQALLSPAAVAFDSTGNMLAGADGSNATYLWNTTTGKRIGKLVASGIYGTVRSVAFSPNGKLLAVGETNGHVYVWDVAEQREIQTLVDPGGSVAGVAFSPDGRALASGDQSGTIYLWNAATGNRIGTLVCLGQVTGVAFGSSSDVLAAADSDGSTYLWDVARRRILATFRDPAASGGVAAGVVAVAFSSTGRLLATGDVDGRTYLWNTSALRA